MSGTTATKRQTSKSGAKQAEQGGQTIDQMEQQQRELEAKIEAQRQQERDAAWRVLGEALPLAARGEPFNGDKVKQALEAVGETFEQFKADAVALQRALDDPAGRELESLGLDDRQLSAHIKQLQLDAQKALHEAKCEAGRLRSLVMQRAHRRQSLRSLQAKGYAIDVR